MEEGIIVLDGQNRVVSINPAAVKMIPHPSEKLVGQRIGLVDREVALGGDNHIVAVDLRQEGIREKRDSHNAPQHAVVCTK